MKKNVLILGGTGFIGGCVAAALSRSDSFVPVVASRRPRADATLRSVRLDATDTQALAQALQGMDAVVNCVTGDNDTIVGNARALFDAAATLTPRPRIIHLSSLSAYGSAIGRVQENSPLLGDLDGYSAAKRVTEELAATHENAICIRPGIVYGPGSARWSDLVARLLLARRLGDLGINGDGHCNLLFIDDLVQATTNLLQQPSVTHRQFNLAAAEEMTWNDFFIGYARALGAVPVKRIGRRRWKIETKALGIPLTITQRVLGERRARQLGLLAVPPSFARLCRQDIVMDVSRAEQALGLQWTPSAQGLEKTAAWFHQTAARR